MGINVYIRISMYIYIYTGVNIHIPISMKQNTLCVETDRIRTYTRVHLYGNVCAYMYTPISNHTHSCIRKYQNTSSCIF